MYYSLIFIAAVIAYFGLVAINVLLYRYNKSIHGGPNNKLIWYYHLRRYTISVPPLYLSAYNLQIHNCEKENLAYFTTLDDPVVKQIAEDFNDMFVHKSISFKAHCLQAMIQQNVKYVNDMSRFGVENCWCFPIRTLITKIGDCEDSAILYASLATAIGLDVVLIYFPTHMLCGVRLYKDNQYIPLELTKYLPVNSSMRICCGGEIIYPSYPSEEFLSRIDRY